MSSTSRLEGTSLLGGRRRATLLGGLLAGAFLLANLVVRVDALRGIGGESAANLWLGGLGFGIVACVVKPMLFSSALFVFGASFFLYGFHSYRPQSQAFELLASACAVVLLVRRVRSPTGQWVAHGNATVQFAAIYALLATASLLLLPGTVLVHRLFLEGSHIGRAILGAFPKDPLYPIASVNRLWLFLLLASLFAAQSDGRALCRKLFRGIAWAALVAAILGVLDFAGLLPLDRYNLSNLFYGRDYRRLQSTFGNPSWFACFVACALPFVWLEFRQALGGARLALAAAFPLCAASLFLSGARAAWLASLVCLTAFAVAAFAARRQGRALPRPDLATWLALGGTTATVGLLAAVAWTTPPTLAPGDRDAPVGRLEGLSREMQYRGLGTASPRRVAAQYALELARLSPGLGLGYESFNMHLRAQLEIPGSGVAQVVNTAIAADPAETVFDDSHSTYLQVLTGTGALGLALWLALAAAGLAGSLRAFRADPSPEALAVALALGTFHFYGMFQGMAYIPVTFALYPLLLGYVSTLQPATPISAPAPRRRLVVATALLLAAVAGYAGDSGYQSLKRRFEISAYLPDEAAEFEGFYRPETGPEGEFRWMARRGIVKVARAQPFRLRFTIEHPDADLEPVVLRLQFEGRDAEEIIFRRRGAVEQRFVFGAPGALRLSVSRTFRPAADRRELGVAVSAIRWE